MKTKISFLVALLVMQSAICKAELSAIDVQGAALTGNMTETSSVDVNVKIEVSLPSFPSIGPISFIGDMKVPFVKGDDNVIIKADKIPELLAELSGVPESFGPVTFGLKVASSDVTISWDDEKNVTVSAVDLHVTAYKAAMSDVSKSSEKMAEFTLEDVLMDVRDVQDKTAHLKFSTYLPQTSNETLNSVLSGKEIVGEVSVRISVL